MFSEDEDSPEFDIEWDHSLAYKADLWIIRLVQMIRDELTDIVRKLQVEYHRFIHLFGRPLATSLAPHPLFTNSIELKEVKTVS